MIDKSVVYWFFSPSTLRTTVVEGFSFATDGFQHNCLTMHNATSFETSGE